MFIHRFLTAKAVSLSRKFPIVAITGPRQSGKTTFSKAVFPKKPYVSLENLDEQNFAETDPRGFLNRFKTGAILDEVQNTPALFSYLQGVVDESKKMGQFILTGSHQFLMNQHISQSLAGRVGYLTMLPFSMEELGDKKLEPIDKLIYKGFYPPLFDRKIDPVDWFPNYVRTYVQRDVRSLKNIGNLSLFQRFLRLCSGYSGQLINLSNLANDSGVNYKTINSWIGLLEASYLIYRVEPYYNNFRKRIVKTPKLYFFDTGLACYLQGISSSAIIHSHPLRGSIFETFIVSEIAKKFFNAGKEAQLFFWQDKNHKEVDLILDSSKGLLAIEIKSSQTLGSHHLENLKFFKKVARKNVYKSFLIYGGENSFDREGIQVLSWKELSQLNSFLNLK